MNIIDEIKYNEIKNIIEGCNNINDAKYFINLYVSKTQDTKKISEQLMESKYFYNVISLDNYCNILEKINNCEYKEDCEEILKNNNFDKQNIKYKTIERIMDTKKNRNIKNSQNINTLFKKKIKFGEIEKFCPHCSKSYIGNDKTLYVVCGYEDKKLGYDWKGCQKDWCFHCNKKLCKNWNDNKLFLEQNRHHNSECCKKYAINNLDLYENYCKCNNKYVNRKL